jgi:hypothetical protein
MDTYSLPMQLVTVHGSRCQRYLPHGPQVLQEPMEHKAPRPQGATGADGAQGPAGPQGQQALMAHKDQQVRKVQQELMELKVPQVLKEQQVPMEHKGRQAHKARRVFRCLYGAQGATGAE